MKLGRIVIGGSQSGEKDEQFLDDVEGVQGRTSFYSVLTKVGGRTRARTTTNLIQLCNTEKCL